MAEITSVQKSREISALLAIPGSRIIAGGTALSPEGEKGICLIDISEAEGLDGIRLKGNRIEMGPLAALSALADSEVLQAYAPALAEAAASAATPEIRARATLGGNLASDRIGDTAPVLVAYGAKLTIKTGSDFRELLIDRFWDAEGKNDLDYDEWIMKVSLQIPRGANGAAFGKTGEWDLTRQTAAAAAIRLSLDEAETVTEVRGAIRLGHRDIRRMFPLEKALKNRPASAENTEKAVSALLSGIPGSPSEKEDISRLLTDVLQRAIRMAKERRTL